MLKPVVGLSSPIPPVGFFLKNKKGSIKHRIREKLHKRQRGLCAYCDEPIKLEYATLDHITAESKGGKMRTGNIAVVCHDCNYLKGDISSVQEANDRMFVFAQFIARLQARGYLK